MAKLPEERFSDGKRIRELIQAITELFEGSDLEHLSIDHKVHLSFQHEKYPIYRRMMRQPMSVEGYWWLPEIQKLQYAWNGYADAKLQSKDGVNRIWLTRKFQKGWLYIRESNGWYDIEGYTATKHVIKGENKTIWEWVTCTVSKNEYDRLDKLIGPRQECCIKNNHGVKDDEGNLDERF